MDATQVAELYRKYAPLVHARARRLVGAEADDVVQEVFLKVLRDRPEAEAMLKWMYVAATNACLDRLRSQRRHGDAWQGQARDALSPATPRSLDEAFASADLARRVLALADRQTQQLAVLVHVDQMTQEEAGELLGISRKTVGEKLKRLAESATSAREVLT